MYPQVFGKYVIERELARGGMARVVLATLRGAGGFEKRLVVKQIRDELASDDEFVRRFVDEAKTTVALAHPNIVPVYELGMELGTYFLAMELVEGVSLAELLKSSPQGLTADEGAYVGVEVCRALDYAHRRMNVVHRDVTPRNVMVDEEGLIKVIDFGIAAPVATAPDGHGVFGSPGHMPPEQMEGRELTAASDVFAVAVLLMELWSGKPPFRRRTKAEIEATMRSPHPRPSDLNVRLLPLDDVMASAMALDPRARPQQADDLGRALRRFLAGIDLGDLARQLGDRVREIRTRPAAPEREPASLLGRPPSRPTATQVGTKTFAARDEVRARAADADAETSTRRLPPTPPATAGAEATAAHARGAATDAVPGRPLLALTVTGSALAVVAFMLGRGVVPSPTAGRGPGAAAALPAIAERHANPPPDGATNEPAREAPSDSDRPREADMRRDAPPRRDDARGRMATIAANSSDTGVAARNASPRRAEERRAQLTLLGDGTTVSVDGIARGGCPARLDVEAGTHTVVFSFPDTGESKSERVTVGPADRATLRADFTAATPTIRVEK